MLGKPDWKSYFMVKVIEEVGIVVRDLHKSMENYWNNYGIGPWNVVHFDSAELSDMTYRGKPARFSLQLARSKVGAMDIELIEPLEGDSTWAEFLKENGEGMHHIGRYKVDDIAATIEVMEEAGFPFLTGARNYRSRFAYFDTRKIVGTILEAFWEDYSIPYRPGEPWHGEQKG